MDKIDTYLSILESGLMIVFGITLIDLLPIDGVNIITSFNENVKYIFIIGGLVSLGLKLFYTYKNKKLENKNKKLENSIKKEELHRKEFETESKKLLKHKK